MNKLNVYLVFSVLALVFISAPAFTNAQVANTDSSSNIVNEPVGPIGVVPTSLDSSSNIVPEPKTPVANTDSSSNIVPDVIDPDTDGDDDDSSPNNGRSNRRGNSRSASANTIGQVLGVESFQFTMDLSIGMSNNEVMELQKLLRKEGLFSFSSDTGYFGPITLDAVKAYQSTHGLTATGVVGIETRNVLNATVAIAPAVPIDPQLAVLKAQAIEAMTKLIQILRAQMATA